MKTQITIISMTYSAELEEGDWNAKVRYTKGGKRYLALFYLDLPNREVYFPKNQPKECKVLQGLDYAIKLEKKFL